MPLKEQLIDAIRKNDNIEVSELLDRIDVSAVNETTDQHGMTALHAACENKNDRAFTLLLAKIGIDVNVKDRKGSTPLQMACWCRNDQAILKLLAIPDIQVNVQNRKGHTPLHLACWWRSNDQAVSKLLAIPGIQVNVQNRDGNTPLHRACDRPGNDQAVTKLLAIPDIQVNVQNMEGSTPLHVVYCGQSAAPLLATPGIDVNVKDIYGRTPVMVAAGYHRREEVFKLLLHDPRVDLDIKDNTGSGLEEAVGDKKYLNLIQEERMKRGNVQKKQDKAKENNPKRKRDSLHDLEEENSSKGGKYDIEDNTIANFPKLVVEPEKQKSQFVWNNAITSPRTFASSMDYKKDIAPIGASFSGFGNSLHAASPLTQLNTVGLGLANGNTVPSGSQNSAPASNFGSYFSGIGVGSAINRPPASYASPVDTGYGHFASPSLANNMDTASPGVHFTSPVADRYPEFNQDQLNYVAALNMQVAEWIMKNVKENPLVILTAVFKDYEKHLKSIMESPPTNRL